MNRAAHRIALRASSGGGGALVVSVSSEGVRPAISAQHATRSATIALQAERVSAALISIAFVSRGHMATINARHLGRRGATDVIAFGFTGTPPGPVIGDVYIAPAVARENARRLGVSVRGELTRLVIHGVLHVLGHDHPDGKAREQSAMWNQQELLVRKALARRTASRRESRRTG
jgi:probable rRNA maturation factor